MTPCVTLWYLVLLCGTSFSQGNAWGIHERAHKGIHEGTHDGKHEARTRELANCIHTIHIVSFSILEVNNSVIKEIWEWNGGVGSLDSAVGKVWWGLWSLAPLNLVSFTALIWVVTQSFSPQMRRSVAWQINSREEDWVELWEEKIAAKYIKTTVLYSSFLFSFIIIYNGRNSLV